MLNEVQAFRVRVSRQAPFSPGENMACFVNVSQSY